MNESLEKRLLLRKNYMAERIPCDHSNYSKILERYFFIGLVERYQESFDKLGDLIGKPRVKLKVFNKILRPKIQLSDEFISEFKELNHLDYQIYDYGKKFYENNAILNSDQTLNK